MSRRLIDGATKFPVMFPEIEGSSKLPGPRKKAVASYRQRMKRKGLVRVEVQVLRADAPLLRDVAGALADPNRAAQTRAFLRDRIATRGAKGLKALLADAPFDDIDLERARDMGREAL